MGTIRNLSDKLDNLRSRFSEGTTDHDHDGEMGGSRKGDKTMPNKATKAAKELLDKGKVKVSPPKGDAFIEAGTRLPERVKDGHKAKIATTRPKAAKKPAPDKVPEEAPHEPTREEIQAETSLRQAALGQL